MTMTGLTNDVEKMVLGAILQSEDALLKVMEEVELHDFQSVTNRQIYNAIIDVYRDGDGIDIGLIYARVRSTSQDNVSGLYLATLLNEYLIADNISTYIEQLKDRTLCSQVRDLAQVILSEDINIQSGKELHSEMVAGLARISHSTQDSPDPELPAIYSEITANWQKIARGENVCVPVNESVTSSGVLGWYPGHLICIGGYTSVGKSTYLAQIVTDACREGASVMIFSLEDKRTDKLIKVLANITDLPQSFLIKGCFNDNYKEIIRKGWETIKDYNLLIYDDIYSVETIRTKIMKAKLTGKLDIVCIDFIQNIVGGGGSIYEKMSTAIIELQRMAKKYEVTMIVLSQVSNESMRGDSDIIGLKGAGELASAADIVLWLKRVKGDGNERKLDLEIRKNRPFGETGIRKLKFSERWTRIERSFP